MKTKLGQQEPDTTPGNYYVSAIAGPDVHLMLGPFVNDHAGALAMVDRVKEFCISKEPMAHFMAWGTLRTTINRPGNANNYINMPG